MSSPKIKVVGFANSSNSIEQIYLTKQLESIKKFKSEVEIEIQNENSSLLLRYCKKPDRLPCIMVFKDGGLKDLIHAKLSKADFEKWIKPRIGI